jgi:plasmid stabilization system protein ParE
MRVRYSRRALSQLASVNEYLAERNPAGAANVTASVRRTIARLAEMPFLGKATEVAEVRVIVEPEYLYRVFYVINDGEVLVLRVLHGRQS